MKIICSREALQKGVATVSKAVPSKTTMPILGCIVIHTDADTIKMTANDTELGIETIITGMIDHPGKIALEAKLFSEIVRRLPDGMVTIATDDNDQTKITCEKAKFTIPGRNGEDFPMLPQVERGNQIQLSQFSLRDIIQQTIFSIADNENNKIMSGELMEVNGNQLKLVSLDGHRISIRRIELKETYQPVKVIIPGKTLNDISKILSGDADSVVQLFFTENHVLFEFDDTKVVSRLIEGEYFRINQMLNNDYETKVTLNKKDLIGCIDRAMLLVKENDKKPLIIHILEDEMEIQLNSSIGSMDEELPIDKLGKDIMIGFNPKFLMDALRVIEDEEVTLYLVNPKAPCFIKDKEESYIYLILPVNFNVSA